MNDKQQSAKGPRDLFREIAALCDEVDSATPNAEEAEETSPMHRALEDQKDRDRAKGKNQYSQLLSCRLIDVEIQPFESSRDRASLTIRSAVECFQNSVEIAEGYALIEFLLMTLSSFQQARLAVTKTQGKMETVYSAGLFLASQMPCKNSQQAGCPVCKELEIKKHIHVILKRIEYEF